MSGRSEFSVFIDDAQCIARGQLERVASDVNRRHLTGTHIG